MVVGAKSFLSIRKFLYPYSTEEDYDKDMLQPSLPLNFRLLHIMTRIGIYTSRMTPVDTNRCKAEINTFHYEPQCLRNNLDRGTMLHLK